jgi:Zn-dependent peptidase ImmA (M78 family)
MRRGFKTEAERIAAGLRDEMGLGDAASIDPFEVARHMGVDLRMADDLVDPARLKELRRLQPDAFSAATFRLPSGRTVVVLNPLSSAGRTNSDLAHELSHLILDHDLRRVERVGDLMFFTCDPEQEEEANWLSGCLLLPRPLLLRAAREGVAAADLARQCRVSVQLAKFRLNASGVMIQIGRARQRAR